MLYYKQLLKYFYSHKLLKDVELNTKIVNRSKKHLIKVRLFKFKKKYRVYYHLRQKFFFQKLRMFFVKKKKKWRFSDLFIFQVNILKTKFLNYNLSLKLRQLLKFRYRCNENAFKRYIVNDICNFSNRLDLVCVRSTYCSSLSVARRFICLGFILVNDLAITYWNYYLKKYDFIAIKKIQMNASKKVVHSNVNKNTSRYCGIFFYKFRLRNIIIIFSKIQYTFVYFFYKFYRFHVLINLFYLYIMFFNYMFINILYIYIFSINFLNILFFRFLFNLKQYKTQYLYNKRDSLLLFKHKNSLNYFKYVNSLIVKFNFIYLLFTVNRFKYIMFSANRCLKNACFGLFGFFKFRIIILFLFKSLRYYYRSYFYYHCFFNGLMLLMIRKLRVYFLFLYFFIKTIRRMGRNLYMFFKKRIKRCLRVMLYLRKRVFKMSISFYMNQFRRYYRKKFYYYLVYKIWYLSQNLFQFRFFMLNYRPVLYNNLSNNTKISNFVLLSVMQVRTFYSVIGFRSNIKSSNGRYNTDHNADLDVLCSSFSFSYGFFLREFCYEYFFIHFSDCFFHIIDFNLIDINNFYDFNNDLNLLLFQLFIKVNYIENLFFFQENFSVLLFIFNFDILFSFFFFNIFCCDILCDYNNLEYFIMNCCDFIYNANDIDLNCKQFKYLVNINFIDESFKIILNIFKKFMYELNLFCLFLEKKLNELTLIDLLFLLFNFLKTLFLKYKILFLHFDNYCFNKKLLNYNFVNFDFFCYNNLNLYNQNIMILKNNYKCIYNFKLLNIFSLLVFFKCDFNYFFFLKKLRYNGENIIKINSFNINYIYSFFYYLFKIFNIFFFIDFFYILNSECILYCSLNLIFFFFNFIYIFYIFYLYFLFINSIIDIFLIYYLFYLIFFKLNNFFIIFFYFKQFTNDISKFISNWFYNIIYFFFFNRNIFINLIYSFFMIQWNEKRRQKRVMPLLFYQFFSVNSHIFQYSIKKYYRYLWRHSKYTYSNAIGKLFVNYMWWFYVKYYVYKSLHGLSVDNLIYWKFMRLKYLNFYFSKSFIYRDIEIQRLSFTFIYIGSTNSFIRNLKNNYNFFFMLILRFYKYRRSSLN